MESNETPTTATNSLRTIAPDELRRILQEHWKWRRGEGGSRANLAGANLAGAYLAGAYLADADLAGAKNIPNGIAPTSPAEPYVRQAPSSAVRADRARRYRERHPEVPVVPRLDSQILERVEAGTGVLNMSTWHGDSCGTTHCRAGWAIHLAGDAGRKLEETHGPRIAGAMIYRASVGRAPHFFASDACALDDIKRCAAEEKDPAFAIPGSAPVAET